MVFIIHASHKPFKKDRFVQIFGLEDEFRSVAYLGFLAHAVSNHSVHP